MARPDELNVVLPFELKGVKCIKNNMEIELSTRVTTNSCLVGPFEILEHDANSGILSTHKFNQTSRKMII